VTGLPDHAYISHDTPMVMYLNAHIAIDQLRHRNEREGKIGAKVRLWLVFTFHWYVFVFVVVWQFCVHDIDISYG